MMIFLFYNRWEKSVYGNIYIRVCRDTPLLLTVWRHAFPICEKVPFFPSRINARFVREWLARDTACESLKAVETVIYEIFPALYFILIASSLLRPVKAGEWSIPHVMFINVAIQSSSRVPGERKRAIESGVRFDFSRDVQRKRVARASRKRFARAGQDTTGTNGERVSIVS